MAGKEDGEHIKGANLLIEQDTEIQINEAKVKVYNVPCHTRGHLLYHFNSRQVFSEAPNFLGNSFTIEEKKVYEFESE